MTTSINKRNCWKYVPTLNKNEMEKEIKSRWESLPYENVGIQRDKKKFENPLQALRQYIKNGLLPPPELLTWLDESFSFYYQKGGDVELEEIFFGHRVPRGGNEARRQSGLVEYFPIFSDWNEIKKHKTINENANDFLRYIASGRTPFGIKAKPLDYTPDLDSFLSQWRRWKRANK